MCCKEVVKALDEIVLAEGDDSQRAESGMLNLVLTCFGDCSQTVTQGLSALCDKQKRQEEETGRTLHTTAILAMLERKDRTIGQRRRGLQIARELLDPEVFSEDFARIEGQYRR